MARDIIVLGAGIVGVSLALHLRKRGQDVILVDRQGPGEGTSFGNAGLLQREAVFPHAFPREMSEIGRIATNRAVDAVYHPSALPGLASPLLQYWRNSAPDRYAQATANHARLIVTCLDEHMALATEAEATDLLRPIGWTRMFSTQASLDAGLVEAEAARRDWGVNSVTLDTAELAAAEPHLKVTRAGAIHWTDPYSVSDPHALTIAYTTLFQRLGGIFAIGDALTLEKTATGWRVQTADGPVEAATCVIALGPQSPKLTTKYGYAPPLFGKRGYHRHFKMQGNAVLNRPMLDTESRFMLIPMRAGIRLTTGAEFASIDAPPTPIQMERAEPIARALLPLADAVEPTPWMGVRPATPDMIPILGRLPGEQTLWCCFGHAHQGLTLGPTTGRLVAEMITGETPFIDPTPYRPERF